MVKQRVTVICVCGGDKFDMPANPKASDTIRCRKCGEEGLCGDVMTQTISALEQQLTQNLRNSGINPDAPQT